LCCMDCSASRNAAGIVEAIYKELDMCGVKNIPIVAQSYDGACVMSGHVSGVQQRIKATHLHILLSTQIQFSAYGVLFREPMCEIIPENY